MAAIAAVANTDKRWYDSFRPQDELRTVDEVNFWRPKSQTAFKALNPGEPLFFRLKSPVNSIAGFGFFAIEASLTVSDAWKVFEKKNGDPDFGHFLKRIAGYRRNEDLAAVSRELLSCLVLRDAVFLPSTKWLPWRQAEDWHTNIMTYKRYDLIQSPQGTVLAQLMSGAHPGPLPDFAAEFVPLNLDSREIALRSTTVREGQGTFKLRLLSAYSRCALTGEHSTPVLDGAHIQSYLGPASNHVQNGMLFRADLHRLYDGGYITVTPSDYRLEVSRRLREEFDNGKQYYEMAGRRLFLPRDERMHPSRAALQWHAENKFH